MTVQTDGTKAKDIAIYYLKRTNQLNPSNMPRTVRIAKALLSNYSYQSIIDAIDYLIDSKFNFYSLGYLSGKMEEILNAIEYKKRAEQAKVKLDKVVMEKRSEVIQEDESTSRNRNKAGRFGVQSRFGEKFNFDLFEGR